MAGPRKLVDGPRFTPSATACSAWPSCAATSRATTTGRTASPSDDRLPGRHRRQLDHLRRMHRRHRHRQPFAAAGEGRQHQRSGGGARPRSPSTPSSTAPRSGWTDARTRAEEALAPQERWQIERAFWTGQAAGTDNIALPHLAHAAAAIIDAQGIVLQSPAVTGVGGYPGGAGPLPIAQGIGILEQLLADCLTGPGSSTSPSKACPS